MNLSSLVQTFSSILPNILTNLGLNKPNSTQSNQNNYYSSYGDTAPQAKNQSSNSSNRQNASSKSMPEILTSFPNENLDGKTFQNKNTLSQQFAQNTNDSAPNYSTQQKSPNELNISNFGYPTDFIDDKSKKNVEANSYKPSYENFQSSRNIDSHNNIDNNSKKFAQDKNMQNFNNQNQNSNTLNGFGRQSEDNNFIQNLLNIGNFSNLLKNFNLGNNGSVSNTTKILSSLQNNGLDLNSISKLLSGIFSTKKEKNNANIMQSLFGNSKKEAESSKINILENYKDVNEVDI